MHSILSEISAVELRKMSILGVASQDSSLGPCPSRIENGLLKVEGIWTVFGNRSVLDMLVWSRKIHLK
jgi:hypothetical protein